MGMQGLDFFLAPEALAYSVKITPGLPGPLDPSQDGGVLAFVQNAYLLALAVAGLLALGSIAYGAVQYTLSRGNPAALADAWDRIVQALVGALLLVGAGAILAVVNPGLTTLQLPYLAPLEGKRGEGWDLNFQIGLQTIKEKVNDENYQRITGGRCAPISAAQSQYCNPQALEEFGRANNCAYRGQVWDGTFMSIVCRQESSARTNSESGTDRCYNRGQSGPTGVTFSGGLFQINIIDESKRGALFPECRGALLPYNTAPGTPGCNSLDRSLGTCIRACKPVGSTRYCPLRECGVANAAAYATCKQAVFDPVRNMRAACQKFRTQGNRAWAGTVSHIATNCR